VILFRNFEHAYTQKARELKASFNRETVRRLAEVELRTRMEHMVTGDMINMMEYQKREFYAQV